jgi:hypothetical protein
MRGSIDVESMGDADFLFRLFLQAMSEEEQKLFRLYGKLPTHKNVLAKMQKVRPQPHLITSHLAYADEPRHKGPEVF